MQIMVLKILMVSNKTIHKALRTECIKPYERNPLGNISIFIISQNYTLALTHNYDY